MDHYATKLARAGILYVVCENLALGQFKPFLTRADGGFAAAVANTVVWNGICTSRSMYTWESCFGAAQEVPDPRRGIVFVVRGAVHCRGRSRSGEEH